MAFNPATTPFLLPINMASDPTAGVGASSIVTASGGLQTYWTGAGGSFDITTQGNLAQLDAIITNGILVITDAGDTLTTRTLTCDNTLSITNPQGVSGNPVFSVVPRQTNQCLLPMYEGDSTGFSARPTWNFIAGSGITINISDNPSAPGGSRTDIQIASTAAAGTVSSVGVTSSDGLLTVTGSPITSSGVIGLSVNTLPVTKLAPSSTNGYSLQTLGGVVQWAPVGSGGGGISSINITSGDTGLGITQSTTSGAYTATIDNSWWKVAADGNVSLNGNELSAVGSISNGSSAINITSVLNVTGTSSQFDGIIMTNTLDLNNNDVDSVTQVGFNTEGITTPLYIQGKANGGSTGEIWITDNNGNFGQVYDTHFNPGGGGGGGVSSVGLTSTGDTVTITGATSPITSSGTYNIEVPNWATVIPSQNVGMNSQGIDYISYISLTDNNSGGRLSLQASTTSSILTVTNGANTGNIYDSYFNPPPGGSSSIPGAANSMTAATTLVIGTTNIAGTSPGANNYIINNIGIPSSATSSFASNTFLGQDAGLLLTAGSQNVIIGSNACDSITVGGGNTAIGYAAGPQSGNSNACVFIGSTSQGAAGISNSIAIGESSTVNSSNAMVLGNSAAAMSVGIGTNTPDPTAMLHLATSSSPTPTALLMGADLNPFTGSNTAPAYAGAGYYLTATPATGTTAGSWLMAANAPSARYLSVATVDLFAASSFDIAAGYPFNSLLVTPSELNSPTPNKFFSLLTVPSTLNTNATAFLGVGGSSNGINWYSTPGPATSFLAMSFPTIGSAVAPANPEQNVSYIALPDPEAPNDPTFFSLPSNLSLGSSFRVVGCNVNGWIVSTDIAGGINQRIAFGNKIVLGTPSGIAGIQCNPADAPSSTGYLSSVVELVYSFTEGDGTQVWTVVNAIGELDMFQS